MQKKLFLGALMILACFPAGHVLAVQPEATFDYTLETLRQSVATLAKENQALNAQNLAMRGKIRSFEENFNALGLETSRLETKKKAELEKMQRRHGGAEALKAKLVQAEETFKKGQDDLEAQQGSFKALEGEESALQQKVDALNAEIAAIDAASGLSEEQAQEFAALQAERDQVQKEFYAAADRFLAAKKEWQDMNALVTTGPKQLDILKTEQAELKKAAAKAELELAGVNARLSDAQAVLDKFMSQDHSDLRVGRLESEVKDMEERDQKLQAEITALQKSSGDKARRAADERAAAIRQYEARQQELSRRNIDLRAELDSLRKQMISLDKKKSAFESGIYAAR